MFHRVRPAAIALIAFGFTSQVFGQQTPQPAPTQQPAAERREIPASELPDATAVFDRYIQAIGGRDEVMAVTTRKISSRLSIFILGQAEAVQSGRFEIYAQAPNILVQDLIFPGRGTTRVIFDGENGWNLDETDKATKVAPSTLERIRGSAYFYQVAKPDEMFTSYRVIKGVEAEGIRAVQVAVTHRSGREEVHIYDLDTGLHIATVGKRELDGTDQQVDFQRSYSDYKKFGNVLYPTKIIERYSNIAIELTLTNVATGITVPEIKRPDGLFESQTGG